MVPFLELRSYGVSPGTAPACGSVVALTRENLDGSANDFVKRYRYDAFGNDPTNPAAPQAVSGPDFNPYLFTARRYDSEMGLYYYRARYFSPRMGRFLQRDPAGYADGMNLYEYVGGNPITRIDPSGMLLTQSQFLSARSSARAESIRQNMSGKMGMMWKQGIASQIKDDARFYAWVAEMNKLADGSPERIRKKNERGQGEGCEGQATSSCGNGDGGNTEGNPSDTTGGGEQEDKGDQGNQQTQQASDGETTTEETSTTTQQEPEPGEVFDIPEDVKSALEDIFGEGSIEEIKIIYKPKKVRWHGIERGSVTRRGRIFTNLAPDEFFSADFHILHEFYHVVKQWDTGRMTRLNYLWERIKHGEKNKWEMEANIFARENLEEFRERRDFLR